MSISITGHLDIRMSQPFFDILLEQNDKTEFGGLSMQKEEKKMTETDVAVICSVRGVIAGLMLVVDSFISETSKILRIMGCGRLPACHARSYMRILSRCWLPLCHK